MRLRMNTSKFIDRPNRKANTISCTHMVIAPVAGMSHSAPEPWPSCHTQVSTPYAAASEIRLDTTALAASTERLAGVIRARHDTMDPGHMEMMVDRLPVLPDGPPTARTRSTRRSFGRARLDVKIMIEGPACLTSESRRCSTR